MSCAALAKAEGAVKVILSGKCPVPLDRREEMELKSLCMESHAPLNRERGGVKVVSRGKSCAP